MNLLLNLLLLCLLSCIAWYRWRHTPVAVFFWPALLLKLLSGWGLLALYRYHYGWGDVLDYHGKATVFVANFWEQPQAYFNKLAQIGLLTGVEQYQGHERVDYLIKLISPVYVLTNSNSWLTSAWLSFFSFLGLFWLVRRLSDCYTGSGLAAAGAFLFWPSMLMWTGSITKEALVMPAIAVLVAVLVPYLNHSGRSRWWQWLLALLAAWIVWRLKYYFALPLFAILAALVLAVYLERRQFSRMRVLLLLGAGMLVAALLISQLHPNLYPERVLEVLVENYTLSSVDYNGTKQLYFEQLQPSVWSVLFYSPKALAGGLLMPLPLLPLRLEVLPLLAGAENLLVLLLLIGAFYKYYRKPIQGIPLPVLGLVLYVGILAVAMAIASPNFGTLLRYRTAYLPFAVFLLLYWLFPVGWRHKQKYW